ncbi:unnamed protein product [Lampetra planeri]
MMGRVNFASRRPVNSQRSGDESLGSRRWDRDGDDSAAHRRFSCPPSQRRPRGVGGGRSNASTDIDRSLAASDRVGCLLHEGGSVARINLPRRRRSSRGGGRGAAVALGEPISRVASATVSAARSAPAAAAGGFLRFSRRVRSAADCRVGLQNLSLCCA